MKIYCSCCDKVQPVRIDNCRDAKTNEPFQDIVCAECDLVIASGIDIVPPEQEPVIGTKTWFEDGKVVTQHLTAKDIYKEPEPVIDKSAAVRIATSLGWEPKRKPLTNEQIGQVARDSHIAFCLNKHQTYEHALTRAIEAAHGIKE